MVVDKKHGANFKACGGPAGRGNHGSYKRGMYEIEDVLRVCLLAVLAGLSMGAPASLLAQSAGTAALTGTITDSSGGRVANVTVTLTSAETNQSRTTVTGSDGTYRFSLLPPGTYSVKFAANE